LIKATSNARDDLIGLENRHEDEIRSIRLTQGAPVETPHIHHSRRTAAR
jgi:low affinity Fe/Cu permease